MTAIYRCGPSAAVTGLNDLRNEPGCRLADEMAGEDAAASVAGELEVLDGSAAQGACLVSEIALWEGTPAAGGQKLAFAMPLRALPSGWIPHRIVLNPVIPAELAALFKSRDARRWGVAEETLSDYRYQFRAGGVGHEAGAGAGRITPLSYVLVHEIGHVIDANFGIVSGDYCDDPGCAVRPESFAAQGWEGFNDPRTSAGEAARSAFCPSGSDCFAPEGLDAGYFRLAFSGLEKSGFVTPYATVNPWEDFAETYAMHYFASRSLRGFSVSTGGPRGGVAYDYFGASAVSARAGKEAFLPEWQERRVPRRGGVVRGG